MPPCSLRRCSSVVIQVPSPFPSEEAALRGRSRSLPPRSCSPQRYRLCGAGSDKRGGITGWTSPSQPAAALVIEFLKPDPGFVPEVRTSLHTPPFGSPQQPEQLTVQESRVFIWAARTDRAEKPGACCWRCSQCVGLSAV